MRFLGLTLNDANPELKNLMKAPFNKNALESGEGGWLIVGSTVAALSYFEPIPTNDLMSRVAPITHKLDRLQRQNSVIRIFYI